MFALCCLQSSEVSASTFVQRLSFGQRLGESKDSVRNHPLNVSFEWFTGFFLSEPFISRFRRWWPKAVDKKKAGCLNLFPLLHPPSLPPYASLVLFYWILAVEHSAPVSEAIFNICQLSFCHLIKRYMPICHSPIALYRDYTVTSITLAHCYKASYDSAFTRKAGVVCLSITANKRLYFTLGVGITFFHHVGSNTNSEHPTVRR